MFPDLASSSIRRSLRLASGLVLFVYITAHLVNHSLGLVSLGTAEAGLEIAVEVWSSWPGTVLLYGAAAIHFLLALWSVYERRTFRLPPLELLRIALGFMLPILLIGHAANTRLAWELFQMPSDYARVVTNLWVADQRGMQLGLLAPGWLHGASDCISSSAGGRSIAACATRCSPSPCCCRCSRGSASSPWDGSSPPTRRPPRRPSSI